MQHSNIDQGCFSWNRCAEQWSSLSGQGLVLGCQLQHEGQHWVIGLPKGDHWNREGDQLHAYQTWWPPDWFIRTWRWILARVLQMRWKEGQQERPPMQEVQRYRQAQKQVLQGSSKDPHRRGPQILHYWVSEIVDKTPRAEEASPS